MWNNHGDPGTLSPITMVLSLVALVFGANAVAPEYPLSLF